MNKIFEIASAFYGVLIPKKAQKSFINLVVDYLNERYSIETAIGMALRKLHLN
ncbi:MAG: hypothetical protein KGZ42_09465 [Melioribacter sp.]|jgi:hypothetical protein|nr:hypothetical protein [Melioribacter sp.]